MEGFGAQGNPKKTNRSGRRRRAGTRAARDRGGEIGRDAAPRVRVRRREFLRELGEPAGWPRRPHRPSERRGPARAAGERRRSVDRGLRVGRRGRRQFHRRLHRRLGVGSGRGRRRRRRGVRGRRGRGRCRGRVGRLGCVGSLGVLGSCGSRWGGRTVGRGRRCFVARQAAAAAGGDVVTGDTTRARGSPWESA